MRGLTLLLAAVAINVGGAHGVAAAGKIRLAQTSTVTTCMMNCNAQAANCQTTCLVPTAPPTPTSTLLAPSAPVSNATANTQCVLTCTNTQLTCHTGCARLSPSP